MRAVEAVLSLVKDTVFWPAEEEWKEMRNWFHEKYSLPDCIGVIDGTHLDLAFKPVLDGEDYWMQNQTYGVSTTVVCDDKKTVILTLVGLVQSMTRGCSKIQQFKKI